MTNNSNFNVNETEWVKFQKDGARGIYSKDLDPSGLIEKFKIRLMKIEPGGEFPPHTDPYSHLFYIISGIGEGLLEESVYKMDSGNVAFVKAGERHGYRNTGQEDMYMITINIPEDQK